MLVKTANLIREALDWAVRAANGHDFTGFNLRYMDAYQFSADWAQGGPILTEAQISRTIDHSGLWVAYWTDGYGDEDFHKKWMQCDRSELVAGLRCFVASKLGETVDVPSELCGNQPQETLVNQQRPRG